MTAATKKEMTARAFKASGSSEWCPLDAEDVDDEGQQASVDQAKAELKSMLLASLQMQHVVVLAGSGCSLAAGGAVDGWPLGCCGWRDTNPKSQ